MPDFVKIKFLVNSNIINPDDEILYKNHRDNAAIIQIIILETNVFSPFLNLYHLQLPETYPKYYLWHI